MVQKFSYNPEADPKQYLSQGIKNLLSQIMSARAQKIQMQKQNADFSSVSSWAQGSQQGQTPRMQSQFGMDLLEKNQLSGTRRAKPTKDERRYWLDKGYTPRESIKYSRLAAEIGAGIKPRATSKKAFDELTPLEQIQLLLTAKNKALGQYGGMPDPTKDDPNRRLPPTDQKALNLINEMLNKIPEYKEQGQTGTQTPLFQGAPKGQADGKIRVKSPSGEIGTVPASELREALRQGYKRID